MSEERLQEIVTAAVAAAIRPLEHQIGALQAMMPHRLLSIGEVAEMAGVSKKTIYRRVNQGFMDAVPRKSGTYFLPEEVDRAFREGVFLRPQSCRLTPQRFRRSLGS